MFCHTYFLILSNSLHTCSELQFFQILIITTWSLSWSLWPRCKSSSSFSNSKYLSHALHSTIIPDALILYSGKRPSYFAHASLILSNPLPYASIIPLLKKTFASLGLYGLEECFSYFLPAFYYYIPLLPQQQLTIRHLTN